MACSYRVQCKSLESGTVWGDAVVDAEAATEAVKKFLNDNVAIDADLAIEVVERQGFSIVGWDLE